MAYGTNTNYYNDINYIKNSYASTISGQISRIEDAHKAIKAKARELGLSIPKGAKLTHNLNGTTDLLLSDSHHILDTAAAINNIPVNNDTDRTIEAGISYTVPVGYNKTAYVISAKNLGNQTDGTAIAEDILYGKTAWVDGVKLTGTLPNLNSNQTTNQIGSYQSSSKNYLYFSIPKTGKYIQGNQLQSNIPYYAQGDVEIPVTITTTTDGKILAESTKTILAGYYPNNFVIKAIHEKTGDDTPEVINISNTLPQLTSQTGNLTIQSGFDYFSKNASYSIKSGSITDVEASVNSDTGEIIFTGGEVTEAGWISNDIAIPTKYTPVTATFTRDAITGKLTVSTAGWVLKNTVVGDALNKATVTLSSITKASAATTINGISIDKNHYYVKYTTTAGYLSGTETGAVDLDLAVTTNSTSSATSGQSTISTQKWKVTTTKGYNPSTAVTELKVQDGTINNQVAITTTTNSDQTKTYTCALNITKSGWIDAKSITLNINAIDDKYTLADADLNGTGIKVYADDSSLMTSLEVDMGIIVDRLSAI